MSRLQALLIAAAVSAPVFAQTLVVPSAAAAVDGNSSTGYPLDIANGRLIYIYDSTHFTNNGVNFPILISQISYRANATTTTWTGATSTLTMDLSTAPIDFTTISTTWSANHGNDLTNVYNGPFTIAAGASTAGVPGPFYATVTFSQPFLYDPSLGDLTIDTMIIGNTTASTPTLDAVSTTGTANARRVYSLTNPPAATATSIAGEIANVLEFTYTPASGLYAGFTADVTGGVSPLAVNFTDSTFTSDPNGITSWAWDFDGDSVIDSNLQNPTFVYANCGTYNVSLTVTDGTHAPNTHTKTAYITTDAIAANFTYQVVGPLTVQFTDTSNVPATSWAWDLDGDNLIDSTAQNPAWVYPNTLPVNVTLTATRLCSAPSVLTKQVVAAQQLTTVLVANNSVGAPATLYYDLNVLNPNGVLISSFDSVSTTLSTPFTVDWYVMTGSYVGSALTPAPWTFVGQASGTSNAVSGAPSNAAFAQPIYLPAGSYGIAMRYVGITARYVTLPALTTYGNGDLSLTAGAASLSTAGPFTGTNLNSPRGWCGTLYYSTHNITGEAGYGFFAPGCAGSLGASHFTANRPQLGTTLTVNVSNMPTSVGIMMTGFSNTNSVFGPLPFDVTIYGAPGCFGRVSTDATTLLLGAGNTASWGFSIPNNPALSGVKMFNQALVLDPGFNALGAVLSDAAAMLIGN